MSFYSKQIAPGDWTLDNVTGEYKIVIEPTEHNLDTPAVVSVFESSLSEGFRFVVGETKVNPDGQCSVFYNEAISGRIVIRGE